jgi:hypothetical protein
MFRIQRCLLGPRTAVRRFSVRKYLAHSIEYFADLEIVLGLDQLQQGPLEHAVAEVLGGLDLFSGERVETILVHARGNVIGNTHKISSLYSGRLQRVRLSPYAGITAAAAPLIRN